MTNASLAGLSFLASSSSFLLSDVHQVLICETYVLPQLRQFWGGLQKKLAQEGPYIVGGMRLRLHKLQAKDKQAWKIKAEHSKGWEDINRVLHYQDLPYVLEVIRIELISRHHSNSLAGHFEIKKTRELFFRKYYWPTLCREVEDYVKRCNVYLATKVVRYKPYGDLRFLPFPTHH